MADHLSILTKYIQEKYPEGQYLYKSCSPFNESWIVVLQPIDNSVTNQTRLPAHDHNRKWAKFRANKFKVIDIINKIDQTKKIKSVESSAWHKKIKYIKGVIVQSDSFDIYLEEVCSNGIHFFESIEGSFYYELDGLKNYTGHWIKWSDDGRKIEEGDYSNGKKNGSCVTWYENGRKMVEGCYSNSEKNGCWTIWNENGQKKEEINYLNGKKHGLWAKWHENGKNDTETNYLNGIPNGSWVKWYESGPKYSEGEYLNGELHGRQTTWYENGQKKEECNYLNGRLVGEWTFWYENGLKYDQAEYDSDDY